MDTKMNFIIFFVFIYKKNCLFQILFIVYEISFF